jgi:hypothetical protein
VHIGLHAPQPFEWPLSRILQAPITVFRSDPAGSTDIEPRGLDVRSRTPNRHPSCVPGSSPPQLFSSPLSRFLQAPPTVFRSNTAGSTAIEPRGSMFGLACQTGTPRAYRALAPPNCSVRLSPASYNLPLPYSGWIRQVPPTSSPGGSTFGLARTTGTPRAYRVLAPPNSSVRLSPASYKLHPPSSGRIPQVPPTSLDVRSRTPNRHPSCVPGFTFPSSSPRPSLAAYKALPLFFQLVYGYHWYRVRRAVSRAKAALRFALRFSSLYLHISISHGTYI